jgi:hypothetical protein
MQGFHGRGTVEEAATEGAEVVLAVLFLRSSSDFIWSPKQLKNKIRHLQGQIPWRKNI